MTDSMKEEDKTDLPSTEKQSRIDYPRKDHREEYAAEVTPAGTFSGNAVRERREDTDGEAGDANRAERADTDANTAGRTVGYVGVGLGIASLFLWSIILGPLAAVMGFYAYSQGNKTSGAWAIGLGIVSTLSYFVLMPFTR
ncbi:hypothetical protein NYE69_24550 [Paenibacillus sp. FSL R5-0527]|uniref:hypothetical protein n=1 Tax=Paenibacillus TaxID=44249 RepID=UPI00097B8713|nr:hypothetical protein [Paenibacillus macerans]OMG50924.1 hypothetical protein BK140_03285 [Paenibacillus macerans]